VNAGHPAPVLLSRSGTRTLEEGIALPLGVEPEEKYPVQRVEASEGFEAALLYTDGLVEAENAAGQMLHLGPVLKALSAVRERSCEAVLQTTLGVVNSHLAGVKNADDLTLLALHCRRVES